MAICYSVILLAGGLWSQQNNFEEHGAPRSGMPYQLLPTPSSRRDFGLLPQVLSVAWRSALSRRVLEGNGHEAGYDSERGGD